MKKNHNSTTAVHFYIELYGLSKKSWPLLFRKLLYKLGQNFLVLVAGPLKKNFFAASL